MTELLWGKEKMRREAEEWKQNKEITEMTSEQLLKEIKRSFDSIRDGDLDDG